MNGVLAAAMHWEERAKDILAHAALMREFEDVMMYWGCFACSFFDFLTFMACFAFQ